MKCLKCNYEWVSRVAVPKECPECKTRLRFQRKLAEKKGADYE